MLYEVTYKTLRPGRRGEEKQVKETLLVEAATFGDAETLTYKELESDSSQPDVVAVKRSKIGCVLQGEMTDEEGYFLAQLAYCVLDENSGRDRYYRELALVQASDLDRAKEELDRFCFNARDCEIESVKKSAIVGLLNVSFDE